MTLVGGPLTPVVVAKCAEVFSAACAGALVVLGVPIMALAAAMVGAAISHIPRGGQPSRAIPKRIVGIVADAFIGGWLAVFLLKLKPLAEYGIHEVPLPVAAGLCALLVQLLRTKGVTYLDTVVQALVDVFKRRFGGVP